MDERCFNCHVKEGCDEYLPGDEDCIEVLNEEIRSFKIMQESTLENSDLKAENNSLISEVNKLRGIKRMLETRMAGIPNCALQNICEIVSGLKEEKAELKQRVCWDPEAKYNLNARNKALEIEGADLRNAIKRQRGAHKEKVAELKDRLKRQRTDHNKTNADYRDIIFELEDHSKESVELKRRLAQQRKNHSEEKVSFRSKIKKLTKEKDDHDFYRDAAEIENGNLSKKIKRLEDAVSVLSDGNTAINIDNIISYHHIISFLERERRGVADNTSRSFLRKYFNDSLDRLRVLQSKIEFAKRGGKEEFGRIDEELLEQGYIFTKETYGDSIFVKYEDDPGTAFPSSAEMNRQYKKCREAANPPVLLIEPILETSKEGLTLKEFVKSFGVKGVVI